MRVYVASLSVGRKQRNAMDTMSTKPALIATESLAPRLLEFEVLHTDHSLPTATGLKAVTRQNYSTVCFRAHCRHTGVQLIRLADK